MKKITIFTALASLASLPAYATISLDLTFGTIRDADNNTVPIGTLWALVVDTNVDQTFAGFGLDDSLFEQNILTPGVADNFFTSGQSISVGSSIGGGTIFAMGGFSANDGSTTNVLPGLTLGQNGLAATRNFAFYWFPSAIYTGGPSETISDEVGGIHNNTNDVGVFFDTAMVIPGDGGNVVVGAASEGFGGSMGESNFQAVTLIPEPSSALLAAFGALALLRRRRVAQD